MRGKLVGFALLAASLVALATLGGRGGDLASGQPLPPEVSVDRIAVVGADAQIRTYRADGSDERAITSGDGFFTWPTWSPDGKRIVYSGVTRSASGEPLVALYGYEREAGAQYEIHQSEPGFAGLLAEGVVHYPLWSPDSRKLAFVAVTRRHGLSLFLADADGAGEPTFLLENGPLWMSWSSDSDRLAVHRAREHYVVNAEREPLLRRVALESEAYRVPAWKPGSAEIALSAPMGRAGYRIHSARIADDELTLAPPIASVGAATAFLWSSDGAYLAVADEPRVARYRGALVYLYGKLRVFEASSGFAETLRVKEDAILAFFWSPDGSKIAFVTPSPATDGLRWKALDISAGATTALVDFVPSPDQVTMFQFFDQYAHSHSLWSPDSRRVVFSGRLSARASSADFAAQPTQPGSVVLTIDTAAPGMVEEVAEGTLGFWSPR